MSDARPDAPVMPALGDDTIREVFLAHGFTIKHGNTDLKPYVYAAARALIEEYAAIAAAPAEGVQPVAIPGAVWEDDGVSLIRRGTEDDRCARRGSERLYRLAAQAEAAGVPAPDERVNVPYCLACQKEGHRTTECWSTHGLDTPADWELHRLRGEAALAASRDSQAPAAPAAPVDALPESLTGLLHEARDNAYASLAETDISQQRLDYRKELVARLNAMISALSRPQADMTDEDRIAEAMRLADQYAAAYRWSIRPAIDEERAALEAHLRAALAPAAVLCGCGDQIVPDDAARCGVCAMQDAEDAARYRHLRDQCDPQLRHLYDASIDAARAPQEGSQP